MIQFVPDYRTANFVSRQRLFGTFPNLALAFPTLTAWHMPFFAFICAVVNHIAF